MSENNLFTGYGSPMPTSRKVTGGLFGMVDDAFSSRSLELTTGSHKIEVTTVYETFSSTMKV